MRYLYNIILGVAFFSCLIVNAEVSAQAPGSLIVDGGGELPPTAQFDSNLSLANDPCPNPKSALSKTPDDLASIQSDITRFNLCVQRAQLLERLNEISSQNDNAINNELGNNFANDPALTLSLPPIAPSIPDQVYVDAPNIAVNMPVAPAKATVNWKIKDISGRSGLLHAIIINDDGTVMNIVRGDSLPDDLAVVSMINPSGVTITNDGKKIELEWMQ